MSCSFLSRHCNIHLISHMKPITMHPLPVADQHTVHLACSRTTRRLRVSLLAYICTRQIMQTCFITLIPRQDGTRYITDIKSTTVNVVILYRFLHLAQCISCYLNAEFCNLHQLPHSTLTLSYLWTIIHTSFHSMLLILSHYRNMPPLTIIPS